MHISHFTMFISHIYIFLIYIYCMPISIIYIYCMPISIIYIYISHTYIACHPFIYISHTYIAWHYTFIHTHISYIYSMLQHTYLIHTLNMQDECTNKEWSWAFPNPILTLRILQLGLAQEKPSFHEPPCPPSSWALPLSLQDSMGLQNINVWMGLQLNSSILIHNSCDLHLILGIPRQIIYILKLCN